MPELTISAPHCQIRQLLRVLDESADVQRTGVPKNVPNAHKLIPRYAKEWGCSAMTVSYTRSLLEDS